MTATRLVVAAVAATRIGDHPLLSSDPEDQVRHARGQSLADWIESRCGQLDRDPPDRGLPALGLVGWIRPTPP